MSLLEAAAKGDIELLREIVEKKKSKCKDIRDNHSWTAIHHAVNAKNVESLKFLLSNLDYFDIRAQSFEGWSVLYLAICKYPDTVPLEIIQLLLEAEPSLLTIKDNEEVSPLHQAVERGRNDVVELLIDHGADVNVFDLDQETPLHYAARKGNLPLIKILIEKGKANAKLVNQVDFDAVCLLLGMPFTDERKLEIVKYLMPYTFNEHPTMPGYYGVYEILKPAVLCCRKGNNAISTYFLENFYCTKYNTKHALIARIEPLSISSHMLCFFLHDEITRYDQFYCQIFRHLDIEATIIKIILNLLVHDDAECVQFASTVTRELLRINFDSLLKEEFLYQHPPDFEIFLSKFQPPFPSLKRLFHFIYSLSDLEAKIFDLLMGCLTVCDTGNDNMFGSAIRLLLPFIVKDYHFAALLQECCSRDMIAEIESFIPHSIVPTTIKLYRLKPQVISLKRQARDVIRKEVSCSVSTSKIFIRVILAMPLPATMKCYLLHIDDVRWLQNLSY